ncbi:36bff2d5-db37-4c9d-86af-49c59a5174c3 [Thermothielavioides terrestris]
MSKEF